MADHRYRSGVKALPAPFDTIAAGLPTEIQLTGHALLGSRLLTKGLAVALAVAAHAVSGASPRSTATPTSKPTSKPRCGGRRMPRIWLRRT